MTAAYPTNYVSPTPINDEQQQQPDNGYNNPNYQVDDEQQQPGIVYINPNHPGYYDHEQIPERIDPTAQSASDLNSDVNSYYTDDSSPHHHHHHHHRHHHHRHHQSTLIPLTIRRHVLGSDDPAAQKLPNNLQSSSDNIPSSSNLKVTIKRNPIEPEQPIIQPVLYPVAVYINNPAPQYPINEPIQSIEPIREIIKPPSPKKPITPVKISPPPPPPPISPNRYETESFYTPPSRNKNISPRRPIRTDLITPLPATLQPQRVRPGKVVVEEYDDYDEYYRVPSVYTVPEKVISYRTAPGMTTRELENAEMNNSGKPVYVKSGQVQTVTYRTS